MKKHTNDDAVRTDAPAKGLTDNQSPEMGQLSAPLRERGSANSIVSEQVAADAADRVLRHENLTAEEIAEQSAHPGNEMDVGQQAAHAERARAALKPKD